MSQDARVWPTLVDFTLWSLNFIICRMDIMEANSQTVERRKWDHACNPCRREPFRAGPSRQRPLLPLRTMGGMKTPVELAISQMQTLTFSTAAGAATRSRLATCGGDFVWQPCRHLAHTTRLWHTFGGRRPAEPKEWRDRCHRHQGPRELRKVIPPPAAAPQPHTKENKYRLDQADSFLLRWVSLASDLESTSWRRSGWWRQTSAKLHALSGQPQLSLAATTPPKETPVQAVHPAGPSKTECRVVASSWSLSLNGS